MPERNSLFFSQATREVYSPFRQNWENSVFFKMLLSSMNNKALLIWKYWTCLAVRIGTWAPGFTPEIPCNEQNEPSNIYDFKFYSAQYTNVTLVMFQGNLCRANAMFFSTVSLINEHTEVCSVSLKDKHAESHLQNTDLQSICLISPSNSRHNGVGGGKKESNTNTTKIMTFKCLTSNLFFAVKTKQQVISFTMSHYAPAAP